nr:hypothetical protein [Tanacetum cinerariifolium]
MMSQKPRKPKRKDTQVPQPSGPTKSVADEAAYKELGDRLMRAATTASSLEAKHDSGNITKTQSKATHNEPSSQRINLASGLRCQKAIGDTTAQTRFKSVSKHSNDSLLVRDEFVNRPVVENCKAKSSEDEPKVVRKNDDAPLIKECVSDNEEDDVSQPKIKKKVVRPSIAKIEFIKSKQQEKTARKTIKQVEQHRQNTHNEAAYKELGDRLVRAATTTSSLEAKHDS